LAVSALGPIRYLLWHNQIVKAPNGARHTHGDVILASVALTLHNVYYVVSLTCHVNIHYSYSITPHSFIPGLKPANPSHHSLPFFFFRTDHIDSPDCLLLLLSISVFNFLFFYFQWRKYNFCPTPANIRYGITVLIIKFGSLWAPFTVLGPWAPALPGLPMASYATVCFTLFSCWFRAVD